MRSARLLNGCLPLAWVIHHIHSDFEICTSNKMGMSRPCHASTALVREQNQFVSSGAVRTSSKSCIAVARVFQYFRRRTYLTSSMTMLHFHAAVLQQALQTSQQRPSSSEENPDLLQTNCPSGSTVKAGNQIIPRRYRMIAMINRFDGG